MRVTAVTKRKMNRMSPQQKKQRYVVSSLHLSHSLFDRWGTKDDRATTVLHSSMLCGKSINCFVLSVLLKFYR